MSEDMLLKYGLQPKRPEVIDSSMLSTFADCPSLFYLRYVLGLKKKQRDVQREAPLDWGTVWHRMQEVWNNTQDMVQALAALDPWPDGIRAETDRHGRSKERMASMFFEYIEKFAESDAKQFELIAAEEFFHVWDEELDFEWCGRRDRVMRRKRNGKLVVWDYKTTSAMGSYYFEGYENSFQLPGYAWATEMQLTEPVEEVMIDTLYTLKKEHHFFRRPVQYGPAKKAEWRRNVKMYLDDLHYHLDNYLFEPEMWKKNWQNCTRYGICAFADVHFIAPTGDTRLRILNNDYVVDRWDPSREEES